MKRIIVIIMSLAVSFSSLQAQGFGPSWGDWSMSFNANPIVNFVGNMFNGTEDNTFGDFSGMQNSLFHGVTITGKYFFRDNWAVNAGFGFNNDSNKDFSYNDSSNPEKATGYTKTTGTDYMLKGGLSYYFNSRSRVQPLLSVDLAYARSSNRTKTVYEYNSSSQSSYVVATPQNKVGLIIGTGVEFFLSDVVSLGGIIDLSLSHGWSSFTRKDSKESKNNLSRITEAETSFVTGNPGGCLSLNFYF